MGLAQADSYGRRFYTHHPVEYHVEPYHTSVPDGSGKPWAYITTLTGYRVVTHDWYCRGDEKDFDTTEHFRAPTKAECDAWVAAKVAAHVVA